MPTKLARVEGHWEEEGSGRGRSSLRQRGLQGMVVGPCSIEGGVTGCEGRGGMRTCLGFGARGS